MRINDNRATNIVCRAADGTTAQNGSVTLQAAGSANATVTCTGQHVLTQAEYDAVQGATGRTFTNTATATGTGNAGQANSNTATASVKLPNATSGLSLDKSHAAVTDANKNGRVDAGDTVQYSFAARNTGNVTLSNVVVNDSKLGLSNLSLGTLAPGQTGTVAAPGVYTLTDADVFDGQVVNNATVTGTPPSGSGVSAPTGRDTDTVTTVKATPSLAIEKLATPTDTNDNGFIDEGDEISYRFRVTNTGTVTLNGVTIDDELLGVSDLGIGQDTLAPGASVTVDAGEPYTVTFADMNAHEVVNTATADATVPNRPNVDVPEAEDSVTVDVQQSDSEILLTKTATLDDENGNTLADPGETISYGFRVTNTGNVPLSDIVISDDDLGITNLQVPGTLEAGATSATIDAGVTHTVTEEDVLGGGYTNTAEVVAKAPANSGIPDPTDESSATVNAAAPVADLAIDKVATLQDEDGDGVADAGESITYSFEVTNKGNVSLTDVVVNDEKLGLENLSVGDLEPNQSRTVSGPEAYEVTEADIVAGGVVNTADATGTAPEGVENPEANDYVTTKTQAPEASIEVDKKNGDVVDVNENGAVDAGDQVSYSFTVKNTGNVSLSDVVIDDPKLGMSGFEVKDLAPGESVDVDGPEPYTITDADVLAGKVINQASATGTPPLPTGLGPVEDEDKNEVSTAEGNTALAIDKVSSVEDVNGNGVTDAGDVISYTFTVTNTGNITLGDVLIDDANLGIEDLGIGQDRLAPGQSVTVQSPESHTVTYADMQAGKYENTATVDGSVPGDDDVDVPRGRDTVSVPVQSGQPAIELTKTADLDDANGNDTADLGETVNYSFTVKNTGNVPLDRIEIDDNGLGVRDLAVPGTLAPGDTSAPIAAGRSHTITEGNVLAGEYTNTATVTGQAPADSGIGQATDTAQATVPTAAGSSGLTIEKRATLDDTDGDGAADAGEEISYSFVVTNTGNVTLTNVVVNDEKLGVENLQVATLAPGQSRTVEAPEPYSVTQADMVAGSVSNTAEARGTAPQGVASPTASDTNEVPAENAASGLNIVKRHASPEDTNGNGLVDAGDEVAYSFDVTNTGNVTLTDVVVDDEKLGLDGLEVGSLEPGASRTVDAPEPYVITDADVIDGSVVNEAVVTGTPPTGVAAPSDSDTDTVETVDASAAVSLDKRSTVEDTNDNGVTDAGDVVSYTFTVTNTGTISVTDVVVNDEKLGVSNLGIGQDTLAPGESVTVDAPDTYTLTYADMRAGGYENTAIATAAVPDNEDFTVAPGEDTETVDVQGSDSQILLNKVPSLNDENGNGTADLGESIDYTFTVENTGNVPLTDVVISDEALGIEGLEVPGTLEPGEVSDPIEAGESHTITEADILAGEYTNTANVRSSAPAGSGIEGPSDSSDATVDTAAAAGTLTMDKSASLNDENDNEAADAGETIDYSFEVTNTGNVTLTGVVVNDAKLGIENLEVGELAPGESRTVNAPEPYTVTEADVIAGKVVNAATAEGELPEGVDNVPNPVAGDDTTTDTVTAEQGIEIDKTSSLADSNENDVADAGEKISYSFEVTNTGNVTLTGVVVNDAKLGIENLEVGTLAPGESRTVQAPEAYTVSQADTIAGAVTNTARTTGQVPDGVTGGNPEGSDTDEVTTAEASGTLALNKSHATPRDTNANGVVDAGDEVSYSFEVTNSGNVTLTDVVVNDAKLGISGLEVGELEPGASRTVEAPEAYTITDADVIAGGVRNSANAAANAPEGVEDPTAGDDDTVETVPSAAALSIEKRHTVEDTNGNGVTDAGDVVSYTFDVTNAGTITLGGVTIDDEQLEIEGLGIGQDTLAPGETVSVNAPRTYTLTYADMQRGEYVNEASVNGEVPGREDVPVEGGTDEDTVDVQASDSQILLNKTATLDDTNGNNVADLGETVNYSFTVTNTGNVPLSDIVVTDEGLGIEGLEIPGTLAPGATSESVAAGESHTITEEDILAGEYVNLAEVTSKAPAGSGITDPSDDSRATVDTAAPSGALTIEKDAQLVDANGNGVADAGETIDYSFTVTNSGNVTLTGITVDDAKLGVAGLEVGELAPGESRTVEAPEAYTVTEADTVNGAVENAASATGNLPDGVDGEDPRASDTNEVDTATAKGSLDLVKEHGEVEDTNGNGVVDAGDEVSYTFTVTNNGNVALRDVTIDDEKLGVDNLGVGDLAAGQSRTVDAPEPYVITDADVIEGSVVNTAEATGTPPEGVAAPTADDTDTVETVDAAAALSLEKGHTVEDTNDNGVTDAGDVVSYTFTVTNTGTISVTDVVVNDEKLGVSNLGIGQDTLKPGESVTIDAPETYTLTYADMEAGEYVNDASVDGAVPGNDGIDVAPGEDTDTVNVQGSDSQILLNKIPSLNDENGNGVADLGETIDYTFTVENTGNVPLTDVVISDEALGIEGLEVPGTLAPGETSDPIEAGESHTVTQEDIIAGGYTNTANVTSSAPDGSGIEDPTDSSDATVDTAAPAGTITMEKSASLNDANDNGVADAGETIDYSFEVTNTGNVTVDGIVVTDAKLGIEGLEVGELAPGESRTVSAPEPYAVTEADVIAGKVVNAASATGELPDGVDNVPNPSAGDDTTTPTITPEPGVSIDKRAELRDTNGNERADAGERIDYSFVVRNTGNVTLTGVVVNDPKLGIEGLEVGDLAPGETRTVEAPEAYTVTAEDVLSGSVSNTATAAGDAPDGSGLPDPEGSDTNETETGDVPEPSPTPEPTPEPTPTPNPPGDGGDGGDRGDGGNGERPGRDLPRTGADVLGALLMGAGLITAGGLLFLLAARKRRED